MREEAAYGTENAVCCVVFIDGRCLGGWQRDIKYQTVERDAVSGRWI